MDFIREELASGNFYTTAKIGLAVRRWVGLRRFGCLAAYDWIDTATVMMGAPGFVELSKAQIEKLEHRRFKFQHQPKKSACCLKNWLHTILRKILRY